jgi:hypothetical protein
MRTADYHADQIPLNSSVFYMVSDRDIYALHDWSALHSLQDSRVSWWWRFLTWFSCYEVLCSCVLVLMFQKTILPQSAPSVESSKQFQVMNSDHPISLCDPTSLHSDMQIVFSCMASHSFSCCSWALFVVIMLPLLHLVGVGVLLAADSQSTSSPGYQASLCDPWPDVIMLFFFVWQLLYSSFESVLSDEKTGL